MTDKKKILAKIEFLLNETNYESYTDEIFGRIAVLKELKSYINSLQEEPVSETLEKAANKYIKGKYSPWLYKAMFDCFKAGAKWQKEHLRKSAEGENLPEYDREVIVLTQPYPLENSEYAVYFAHRPNPDGWNGKSIVTGKTEHYTPNIYGKGGWNIPDVKYWFDVKLPK